MYNGTYGSRLKKDVRTITEHSLNDIKFKFEKNRPKVYLNIVKFRILINSLFKEEVMVRVCLVYVARHPVY